METSTAESTQAGQAPQRPRRRSRQVVLRHTVDGETREVRIGGGAPITVQSMTTGKTHDVEGCLAEVRELAEAGADIVRVAVPRPEDAAALADIVAGSPVPIVADIHFNHKYALAALEAGVAKVRINPGNIGKPEWEREVLIAAKERGTPIRIGVNGGSLEKDILDKYGYPRPEALFESAMRHVEACTRVGFEDIVISVKHSDVYFMIQSYRLLAAETDYPLHLGVTESGSLKTGPIKSSIGIGSLLADGIGDTIRVSLAADSVKHSDVYFMIQSYRLLAAETDYPLHLGVTESGSLKTGPIKSSIGIGSLLADGIGDTIRVSLAADSVNEVQVGHQILKSLRLGRPGVNVIACPTCGRLAGDLFSVVDEVEEAVAKHGFERDLNVALMGCAVNGPGEAAGADLGVSLGRGRAHLFKHGEIVGTVEQDEIADAVIDMIERWDEA